MAKFGNILSPDMFWTDDNYLYYRGKMSGKNFKVLKKDIETVSISPVDRLKGKLQLIGKGSPLAEAVIYTNVAEKAQDFILKEVGKL